MVALNDIFLFYLHYIKSVVAISCSQSFSGLQAMIQYCGTAV